MPIVVLLGFFCLSLSLLSLSLSLSLLAEMQTTGACTETSAEAQHQSGCMHGSDAAPAADAAAAARWLLIHPHLPPLQTHTHTWSPRTRGGHACMSVQSLTMQGGSSAPLHLHLRLHLPLLQSSSEWRQHVWLGGSRRCGQTLHYSPPLSLLVPSIHAPPPPCLPAACLPK